MKWLCFLLVFMLSCSGVSDSALSATDGAVDEKDASRKDFDVDTDLGESSYADMTDLDADLADINGDSPLAFVPPPTTVCDEAGTPVSYTNFEAEFEKSSRGGSDFLTSFRKDESIPNLTYALSAPSELAPGNKILRSMYADVGEDITIWTRFTIPRGSPFRPEGSWGMYTVMVNGKPSTIVYKHWDGDRQEVILQHRGNGLHLPLCSAHSFVDFEIPFERLVPEQTNEVYFAIRWVNADGNDLWSVSGRVAVFYGGFDFVTHPCVPQPYPVEPLFDRSNPEWSNEHNIPIQLLWIFPKGFRDWSNWRRSLQKTVSPGEEISVEYEVPAYRIESMALVPILDGVPLDEVSIFGSNGFPDPSGPAPAPPATVARGEITFQAPTEPGLHHFWIATWWDPYLPGEGPDGERVSFGPDNLHDREGEPTLTPYGFSGSHSMEIMVVE